MPFLRDYDDNYVAERRQERFFERWRSSILGKPSILVAFPIRSRATFRQRRTRSACSINCSARSNVLSRDDLGGYWAL